MIGGTGAVSKSVETQLGRIAPVERVSGKDRFDTSKQVFDKFFAGRGPATAFVATGLDFPDALSAAVPAGRSDQRLVLAY